MRTSFLSQTILFVYCLLVSSTVNSQTLPNVQTDALWLPKTFQIDGKLSEWNGTLKAFNKAAIVKYTMANDAKNLYLAISSDDPTTTAKILAGGITLQIGGAPSNSSAITYPVTYNTYSYVETGWPVKTFKLLSDSTNIASAMSDFKEIKVRDIKGISDSIVSIYNEYGLKNAMNYTNKTLVWEFSIPLDRVGISFSQATALNYLIRINGVPVPPRPAGTTMPQKLPPPTVIPRGAVIIMENEVQLPTHFDGKYPLAKM